MLLDKHATLAREEAAPATGSAEPARLDAQRQAVARRPSLAALCGAVVTIVGAFIGTAQLSDNSFFTHLATGRLLMHDGIGRLWNGMPDPYTFTAGGRNWIVQSWFASVCYAAADDLAGAAGVRLLVAVSCGLLALLAWRLTRPAEVLVPRVIVTGFVLVVGASEWTSRPLLFGLLCFAFTLVVAEDGVDPRWLVPVGWVWVNTHGSFPLGLVALGALAAGAWLDGRSPASELRALRWLAGGIVAGGLVNPVGPMLLVFPVTMLTRHDVLANVIEWQSPDFASGAGRVFLLTLVTALVLAVRRPSYRVMVPLAVFVAAALLASRNVPVAMLAMVPGVAGSMRGFGSIIGDERPARGRLLAGALCVVGPLLIVTACLGDGVDLRGYPVAAIDWMHVRGLTNSDVRVAEEDYVGYLLELRFGGSFKTFMDDRYELHDRGLVKDYATLADGKPGWAKVLDERGIDVVLWRRDSALAAQLSSSSEWFVAYDDTTATRPPNIDEQTWAKTVVQKPFIVACRASVVACR
jgi:hypothetical protein